MVISEIFAQMYLVKENLDFIIKLIKDFLKRILIFIPFWVDQRC